MSNEKKKKKKKKKKKMNNFAHHSPIHLYTMAGMGPIPILSSYYRT